jgi:hypothetical protein
MSYPEVIKSKNGKYTEYTGDRSHKKILKAAQTEDFAPLRLVADPTLTGKIEYCEISYPFAHYILSEDDLR